MPIWVHIAPTMTADGPDAKKALAGTLKLSIEKLLVEQIAKALPKDKFTTKAEDKPKGVSKTYNAIKIVATLKLKLETAGSKLTTTCELKLVFEGIKTPVLTPGNLLGAGSVGAAGESRAGGDPEILRGAKDVIEAMAPDLIKDILKHPRFTTYGKQMGLPL